MRSVNTIRPALRCGGGAGALGMLAKLAEREGGEFGGFGEIGEVAAADRGFRMGQCANKQTRPTMGGACGEDLRRCWSVAAWRISRATCAG
jgi:hypothetical protein